MPTCHLIFTKQKSEMTFKILQELTFFCVPEQHLSSLPPSVTTRIKGPSPTRAPKGFNAPGTLSELPGNGGYRDSAQKHGNGEIGGQEHLLWPALSLTKNPGTVTPLLSHSASSNFPTQVTSLTIPNNFSSPPNDNSDDQEPGEYCVRSEWNDMEHPTHTQT